MKRSYDQIKEEQPEGQTSVVKVENGKQVIHVIGGCYGELNKISLNYVYNPETNLIKDDGMQFEQKFKKPSNYTDKRNDVSYLNSVCYKNQIYCIGGVSDNKIKTLFRKETNPPSNIKTTISNMYSSGSSILNDELYLSGGIDDTKLTRERTECYKYSFETNTLKQIPSLPYPSFNHCMVAYNNKLYITGGEGRIDWLTDRRHISSVLYIYDGKCWNEVKPKTVDNLLPLPRYKHSSVVCDNKIYLIGGQSSKYVKECLPDYGSEDFEVEENIDVNVNYELNSVDCYDPHTNNITSVKDLPYVLSEMTALSIKIPRTMFKQELLSNDFTYYLLYDSLLSRTREKGIVNTILEYILNEKIYVFKGRSVLSYTPCFNEWVVCRK
jgi:N-acetylneuraminic acid mutarotase